MANLMDIFGPNEAQAFPLGKAFKVGSKSLGSLSSASERLAGREVQGKIIKEVRKGYGNWRDIIFTDGNGQAVTKDYINSLASTFGADKYVNTYLPMGTRAEQVGQAEKSLNKHISLMPGTPQSKVQREVINNLHEARKARSQELGAKLNPDIAYVWVKRGGKTARIPKAYADILLKAGKVQLLKEVK